MNCSLMKENNTSFLTVQYFIFVISGGRNSTWEKITNTKSALWEGEITLSDWVERVNVVARFKEKSPYSSVLEYKVIEKDWK